ncbi:uncharacterized protein PAC_06296 [Phialocephala subalpina]|uniref:Uncharacterized protein n=1 Tax=Phialocephala subalpina TaxID=576137 RepID=A0A1L7WUH4_9HELO|nr:uncharacterized protein PAC_06296 [Phialocephala subalpina]
MWKVDSDREYPFLHKHSNHFPPSSSSEDINNYNEGGEDHWSYQHQYQLSPSLIDDDEEVPIVFRKPSDIEVERERRLVVRNPDIKSPSRLPAGQQPNWPLIPPPLAMIPSPPPPAPTPPPMHVSTERHRPRPLPPITPTRSNSRPLLLPPNLSHHQEYQYREPPTPSSQAPKNVTGLLTDVLSIMNSIMSQQALVASENELLEDLTELVVILQEEAEEMLQMADLVEEYCDEIEVEVQGELERESLEEWADDLGLRFSGDGGLGIAGLDSVIEQYRGMGGNERGWEEEGGYGYEDAGYGHDRGDSLDSGIGMGRREDVVEEREQDGHVGELRLSLHRSREGYYRRNEGETKLRGEHRQIDSDSKSRKEHRRTDDDSKQRKEHRRTEGGSKPKREHRKQESGSKSRSSRMEAGNSMVLVKYDERAAISSSRSRKEKSKNPPQFRDSGLDLPSPENSPHKRRNSRKQPRWI